jgi:hypothetical protein
VNEDFLITLEYPKHKDNVRNRHTQCFILGLNRTEKHLLDKDPVALNDCVCTAEQRCDNILLRDFIDL